MISFIFLSIKFTFKNVVFMLWDLEQQKIFYMQNHWHTIDDESIGRFDKCISNFRWFYQPCYISSYFDVKWNNERLSIVEHFLTEMLYNQKNRSFEKWSDVFNPMSSTEISCNPNYLINHYLNKVHCLKDVCNRRGW